MAKEGSSVVRRLARTRAERAERSRPGSAVTRRAPSGRGSRRSCGALERREDQLQRELKRVIQQEQALRDAVAGARRDRCRHLRQEEADLADQAGALGADAVALAKQAAAVVQDRSRRWSSRQPTSRCRRPTCRCRRRTSRRKAANLQTAEGRAPGSAAAGAEPAAAGRAAADRAHERADQGRGRRARNRPSPRQAPERPHGHAGSQGRLAAADQQGRKRRRSSRSIATTAPAATGDGRPGAHAAHVHDPAGDLGDERRRLRRRPDGELRRSRRRDLVATDARDPRGHRSGLRRALDRLSLARRRCPGRRRERPVGRRRLRRPHGGLSMGLGAEPRRPRHRVRDRPDRELRAADDVRRPLRPLDGLPGVPDQPDRASPRGRRRRSAGGGRRSRDRARG